MHQPGVAGGEDPFAEFLQSQDPPDGAPVYTPTPAAASPEVDAASQLQQLVESSQRQEQLLGKVCGLLVGLSDKYDRVASAQERLEATMQRLVDGGGLAMAAPGAAKDVSRGSVANASRGNLVQPPGKPGAVPAPAPPSSGPSAVPSVEDQRLAQERLASERLRIEEEGRRRAEEIARKREEDERRRREEAERQRLEEERRKEEERQRRQALEKKTTGLMSNLMTGGTGGGLFGDEEPARPAKGGLFDD